MHQSHHTMPGSHHISSDTRSQQPQPVPGALLKTGTSRASLFSLFSSSLHHHHHSSPSHHPSIPALAHRHPSTQGPAPRQALLWHYGFDGFWPTASAHFPRRHTILFAASSPPPESCSCPLFLSSFCQALLLTRTRTSKQTYTFWLVLPGAHRERAESL
ncbi:hypothetical protein V8C42DRAFT_65463 [Trichoderma barbatum]